MKVLVLSPGPDTGGQGIRIKRAFDRFGGDGWEVRSVHRTDSYFRWGHDARWEAAQALYDWADVVHHKTDLSGYLQFDRGQGKPAVIHWQGSGLRREPSRAVREALAVGAKQLVSTVDLLTQAPAAEWLPTPYDLDDLARYRNPKGGRELIVAHAPTNRAVKGTEAVVAAVRRLAGRGYRVKLDVIEGVEWRACLSRKGRAAVFVDQLLLGYGNNAVEAWAMGIPVIAGADDTAVTARMRDLWGEVPYLEASPTNIEDRLAALLDSAELRAEYAERGLAHVRRYHAEEAVVQQLKRIWDEARHG